MKPGASFFRAVPRAARVVFLPTALSSPQINPFLFPAPSVFLFSCFLPCPTTASAGSPKTGITDGTFVGIEQGDYAHFLIKNKKGHDDSFIILRPDKSVQAYLDNPAKLKGHKVRVHWKEQTIPEAGGLLKTVVKVE